MITVETSTDEDPPGFAHLLMLYVPPLMVTAGVFGNIMIIFVIPRIRYLRAFFLYAYVRSISDLAVLLGIMLPRWIVIVAHVRLTTPNSWFCKIQAFVLYYFNSVSFLCLAAMAAQRACAMLRPVKSRAVKQVKIAKSVIVAILIYTFLCQISSLLGITLDTRNCYLGSPISFNKSLAGIFQTWLNFVNYIVIPALTTFGTNAIVLQKMRKIRKRRLRSSHPSEAGSVAGLLAVITFTYCILAAPIFLLEALVSTNLVLSESVSATAFVVLALMVFSNSAINFYLYFLVVDMFRVETIRMLQYFFCRESFMKRQEIRAIKASTHRHIIELSVNPMEISSSPSHSPAIPTGERMFQSSPINPEVIDRQLKELKLAKQWARASGQDPSSESEADAWTMPLIAASFISKVNSRAVMPNTMPSTFTLNTLRSSAPDVLASQENIHPVLLNSTKSLCILNQRGATNKAALSSKDVIS